MPSREGLSGYLSQGSSNTPRRHLIAKWLMMKDFRKKKSHAPDLVEDSSAPFRWTPSWWLSCAFSHLFNGHLWKQFIVRIDAIFSHNLLGIGGNRAFRKGFRYRRSLIGLQIYILWAKQTHLLNFLFAENHVFGEKKCLTDSICNYYLDKINL